MSCSVAMDPILTRRCTLKEGVVAFAFGVPETILSNRRIARRASKKARELGAPVYTQLDIQIEGDIKVEYAEEQLGDPPPTLRIAKGAARWAKCEGITRLWIVAAQLHLWRCSRDLVRAVKEVGAQIEIQVCRDLNYLSEAEWFCADSTQKRTQSRKNWESRERILRLVPFFIYRIIAG